MYQLSKSIPAWGKLSLFMFLLLIICSCDDIIIRDTGSSLFGASYKVEVTTDPSNSRLIIESMGSRQIQHATSPAIFSYTPRPGMPTVVIVSKEGYKTKKIRLTPDMDHLHVVLEKAPLYQLEYGSMTGGGIGDLGRPNLGDIPGMGVPDETTPEEEQTQ
jgi:hypothetical protein